MNRTNYQKAHRDCRVNWRLSMNNLFAGERKVMARVFDNRLPCRDPLMERQYRAVTFAFYGEHAPKPLINEYTFAGKLARGVHQ